MHHFKRVGILGGSFNPIHLGHLILAEEAREKLRLDKVIFVPANLVPHKSPRSLVAPAARGRMVREALGGNPYFEVSDIELKRKGPSYSIETVRKFKTIFRHARLYFIVGSDFLKGFAAWKDMSSLSEICKIVIAERPGYLLRSLPALPKNMQAIKIRALDISSTDIRKRIGTGKSIHYLVPEKVRKHILKKKLYCVKMKRHSKGGGEWKHIA